MRALFLVALVGACYSPTYPDCAYRCDGNNPSCPGTLSCVGGYCTAANGDCASGTTDGAMPDTPSGLENFYTVRWVDDTAEAVPVRQADSCEWAPRLTENGEFLLVNRPTGGTDESDPSLCLLQTVTEVYRWTGDTPSYAGTIPDLEASGVATRLRIHAIVPGRVIDDEDQVELVYTHDGATRSARVSTNLVNETRASIAFPGAPSRSTPAYDLSFERSVIELEGKLYDAAGMYGGQGTLTLITPGLEGLFYSPALSPDGRVLVFVQAHDGEAQLRMMRRREVDQPWENVENVDAAALTGGIRADPFIATNGDLLFTSTHEDDVNRRIFRAPATW